MLVAPLLGLGALAVGEDQHAVAAHTADHRLTDAGAGAQLRSPGAPPASHPDWRLRGRQSVGAKHAGRLGRVEGCAGKRRGGDLHVGQLHQRAPQGHVERDRARTATRRTIGAKPIAANDTPNVPAGRSGTGYCPSTSVTVERLASMTVTRTSGIGVPRVSVTRPEICCARQGQRLRRSTQAARRGYAWWPPDQDVKRRAGCATAAQRPDRRTAGQEIRTGGARVRWD